MNQRRINRMARVAAAILIAVLVLSTILIALGQ